MDSLQTQSLMTSLTAFVQQMPAGQQRSELEQLIAVQSDEGQRQSIRKRALIYPLFVLGLCALVLVFLCVTVVPTFAKMFNEFGMTRPPLTVIVVSLSEQILHHPVRLVLSILALVIIVIVTVRLLRSIAFGTRYLGIIYAGSTPQLIAMAGICNRLADAVSEGLPLPDALRSAAEECENAYFSTSLLRLAHDAQRLTSSPVAHNFPPNLLYALSAGRDGTADVRLLKTLGDIYRERASWRWDIHGGLTGPLVVILMGIVVATVVISLFQPLIDLVSGLS
ncbi:MAG: type II secretion system F family protein [Planctomycetaceae bacterium]